MQNERSLNSSSTSLPAGGPGSDRRPAASVLGSGITVTGNIETAADLVIEGCVAGDVRCATLILMDAGRIEGDIKAARVRLAGSVDGSLDTEDLAVEATARVKGELSYSRLFIANGASVEGRLKCKGPASLKRNFRATKLK